MLKESQLCWLSLLFIDWKGVNLLSKIFSGDNPSQLYMQALSSLLNDGYEVSPRGIS